MGGIWGAGIGSSNNNCRDYALTQALCSLPMRVDGYVHVCVHSPAPPLSVLRCPLFVRRSVCFCMFLQTELFLMRFQTQIFLFEFLF